MSRFSVGIDVRMWRHPGIGRYIRELVSELSSDAACAFSFTWVGHGGDRASVVKKTQRQPAFREVFSPIYSLSEQWEIPWKTGNLDLLHVPHFNVPVLRKKKWVVTVHDLTYVHDAKASGHRLGQFYAKRLFKIIERSAAAILTVSQATRDDLLNTFPGIRPSRVFVTPEAASPVFGRIEDTERLRQTAKTYSLDKPFILFVGSLKEHKNIPTLVHALQRLKTDQGIPHELVLVGKADPKNKTLLALLRRHPAVRCLGELPDPALACLYNLADLFVLPSFREGFGLPVLEAMSCGTPVIVSDRSSLPEVAGNAGLLFDPGRVDALVDLIYNVLRNKDLRDKMSQLGIERAKQFSWKKTAAQTLQIYEQVLG